jgi:hypothetical protein
MDLVDDGSPRLREKWEREQEREGENERDERNGGNETTRVFAVHPEI